VPSAIPTPTKVCPTAKVPVRCVVSVNTSPDIVPVPEAAIPAVWSKLKNLTSANVILDVSILGPPQPPSF